MGKTCLGTGLRWVLNSELIAFSFMISDSLEPNFSSGKWRQKYGKYPAQGQPHNTAAL